MTSLRSPDLRPAPPPPPPRRARGWLYGCALLAALAAGCGGQSLSTDTGNPPVVGQKLQLVATANGVLVTGEPGAVPPGARVDVLNTATAQTASATAAEDGSFQVELAGAPTDEYRVYVGSGQQSWRTRLTSSGATSVDDGIDGRAFLLSSAQGYTFVAGTRLRLAFDDGELSFNAGCNSGSGAYTLCNGRLCASQLSITGIGCAAELHDQDQWLGSFLTSTPELTLAGAALTLRGADATLELLDREVADPDRPLTDRVWRIDTYIQGDAASGGFSLASPPTVEFGSDGSFSVFDSCNTGQGTFTRSGQTLSLSGAPFTDIGCNSSSQVTEHIQAVFAAKGELSFEIEANRLTLMRGSVGVGALTD